jgi:hypothetical protein
VGTFARWLTAGLAVAAAFAIPTLLCGAFILADALKDPAVRWTVACSAGVALAALAALWGNSFAADGHSENKPGSGATEPARSDDVNTRAKSSNQNKIENGIFFGSVFQGNRIFVGEPGKETPAEPGQPDR